MNYKLIKKLPFEQSPEIGYISKPWLLIEDKPHYWNSNWFHPEKYPEFWEEIVELDYEILSYIHNFSKHIWKQDSQLKDTFCLEDGKSPFTKLEDILKYPKIYSIYSIKRKSDDEIFAIGDKCKNGVITSFKQVNSDCPLSVLYNNGCQHDYITFLTKLKKPLFTTEDNVDIFEGDKIHSIDKNKLIFKDIDRVIQSQYFERSSVYKYFSTKEKAEEYILMNKPVLSLKDVASIYISADKPITETTSFSAQNRRIQELVKSKLK